MTEAEKKDVEVITVDGALTGLEFAMSQCINEGVRGMGQIKMNRLVFNTFKILDKAYKDAEFQRTRQWAIDKMIKCYGVYAPYLTDECLKGVDEMVEKYISVERSEK